MALYSDLFFRVLAAILHLGNIPIICDPTNDEHAAIADESSLAKFCSLLQVDKEHMKRVLLQKTISVPDEDVLHIPLNQSSAEENRGLT